EAAKQSKPPSSGGTSLSGTLDDEGFLTSRDEQGYRVFLTENGTWSRNKDEAAKQSKSPSSGGKVSSSSDTSLSISSDSSVSFSSDSSVPPDNEHDESGRQYDDLTNVLRNPQSYSKPLDQTEDMPEKTDSVQEDSTQSQTEPLYDETPDLQPENRSDEQHVSSQSQEKTGGWAKGKRSEEQERGGPTIGKGRVRGTETKGGTLQPEQTGNWTQGKPSEGTGRGGPTIGKGRGGTGNQGGTQQPEQTGNWSQGKPSEGTGRGGPTIGKGRGGTTSKDESQSRPDEKPQGWTGGRQRTSTVRGSGPTIGRGRRGD
ncbi:MAG TPA: hypothetical protein VFN42_06645, partial [Acetobacteraceae bacterium]|nr:hypothetical protein [Acetobacteraceae bacterium]